MPIGKLLEKAKGLKDSIELEYHRTKHGISDTYRAVKNLAGITKAIVLPSFALGAAPVLADDHDKDLHVSVHDDSMLQDAVDMTQVMDDIIPEYRIVIDHPGDGIGPVSHGPFNWDDNPVFEVYDGTLVDVVDKNGNDLNSSVDPGKRIDLQWKYDGMTSARSRALAADRGRKGGMCISGTTFTTEYGKSSNNDCDIDADGMDENYFTRVGQAKLALEPTDGSKKELASLEGIITLIMEDGDAPYQGPVEEPREEPEPQYEEIEITRTENLRRDWGASVGIFAGMGATRYVEPMEDPNATSQFGGLELTLVNDTWFMNFRAKGEAINFDDISLGQYGYPINPTASTKTLDLDIMANMIKWQGGGVGAWLGFDVFELSQSEGWNNYPVQESWHVSAGPQISFGTDIHNRLNIFGGVEMETVSNTNGPTRFQANPTAGIFADWKAGPVSIEAHAQYKIAFPGYTFAEEHPSGPIKLLMSQGVKGDVELKFHLGDHFYIGGGVEGLYVEEDFEFLTGTDDSFTGSGSRSLLVPTFSIGLDFNRSYTKTTTTTEYVRVNEEQVRGSYDSGNLRKSNSVDDAFYKLWDGKVERD